MTIELSDLQTDYLRSWTEPDPHQRRAALERVWANDGALSLTAPAITLKGLEAIERHTSAVFEELIAGKGLTFSYDQAAVAGDALLLRWSMTAPNGQIVGRGVDTIFRDGEGRITAAYMFTGIN